MRRSWRENAQGGELSSISFNSSNIASRNVTSAVSLETKSMFRSSKYPQVVSSQAVEGKIDKDNAHSENRPRVGYSFNRFTAMN